MATTKGRYQTHENKSTFFSWSVIDTEGKTLGERFMCGLKDEMKATQIANALNFNLNPRAYGYKLVD
jgi:hypothetical protein